MRLNLYFFQISLIPFKVSVAFFVALSYIDAVNLNSLAQLLDRRSPEWIAVMVSVVFVEWGISRSDYEVPENLNGATEELDMSAAREKLLAVSDSKLRRQFIDLLLWKKVIVERREEAVPEAASVAIPEWSERERCERKIRSGRCPQQDKVLLALGILSGGVSGPSISSGEVKRHLRDLGQGDLAEDATTHLNKLAEAGDIRLLPDRLPRRETVFVLTEQGEEAIREILI